MTFAQFWEEESSCDPGWLTALRNSRSLVSSKVYATKDAIFTASLSASTQCQIRKAKRKRTTAQRVLLRLSSQDCSRTTPKLKQTADDGIATKAKARSASPPSLTTKSSCPYKYKPSGSPSVFVFITLSRADLKSAIWTLILRSRRAINPASEQMALISAPDRSSF